MTARSIEKYNGLIVPAILLAVWEIATRAGWISATLLVPPTQLLGLMFDLLKTGELLANIQASIIRVFIGFSIGSLIGLFLGLAMGLSRKLERVFAPSFNAFRQISLFAWIPLLILWFGLGESTKYIFIALGAFPAVAINTMGGVANVPKSYLELAKVYEYSRLETIKKIIIPAAFPSIFTGLRLSLGIAWMMVVGAELLAAENGLGYMMTWGRQYFQMDIVMVGVIVIGVIGILLNTGLSRLENHVLRWRRTIRST